MIKISYHGYTATILPERGGNCIDLEKNGIHAFRTPSGKEYDSDNPFLFGTPMLFFPNRISGGKFTFEDREYIFPVNELSTGCFLHGTLHETEFAVKDQKDHSVCLEYSATKEHPYLSFPHAFSLTEEWILSDEGLRQKVIITNHSDRNMPVALAFHTTFRLPFSPDSAPENVRMTLDVEYEFGRDMSTFLPDGIMSHNFPEKEEMCSGTYLPCNHRISRLFKMGDRHEMRLTDPKNGVEIRYCVSGTYGYWMVYNGGNKDFLCVEPQSWLSNCPNAPFPREKTGFDFVRPGESRSYETLTCISENDSVNPIKDAEQEIL